MKSIEACPHMKIWNLVVKQPECLNLTVAGLSSQPLEILIDTVLHHNVIDDTRRPGARNPRDSLACKARSA